VPPAKLVFLTGGGWFHSGRHGFRSLQSFLQDNRILHGLSPAPRRDDIPFGIPLQHAACLPDYPSF
jgi:hypothetical protein